EDLRNQCASQRQLFAIDCRSRPEWFPRLTVDGARQQAPHKTAEEVDRKLAPNPARPGAVEKFVRHQFQQRMRGCQIDKLLRFAPGDILRTSRQQPLAVRSQNRTEPDLFRHDGKRYPQITQNTKMGMSDKLQFVASG
ncbi:MAG: hypothetical protein QOD75_107, partial [Blastocatellia bacterium]|nr:hypothetical protein [Blastocatellia bacterium]